MKEALPKDINMRRGEVPRARITSGDVIGGGGGGSGEAGAVVVDGAASEDASISEPSSEVAPEIPTRPVSSGPSANSNVADLPIASPFSRWRHLVLAEVG